MINSKFKTQFDTNAKTATINGLNCPVCKTLYNYKTIGFKAIRRYGACELKKTCTNIKKI